MKKHLLVSTHLISVSGLMVLLISNALAQSIDADIQISPRLQILPSGEKILRWTGQEDHTFFIQASPDLFDWSWAPNIEPGINGSMSYEVGGPTAKGFYRLVRTDQTDADPDAADFDNDGLGNLNEITPRPRPGGIAGHPGLNPNIQTNPIDSDTDHDGLNDKWEQDNDLDPTDNGSRDPSNGPNGDPDGDGLTNLRELTLGSNPRSSDTDLDGVPDAEEAASGHNLASNQSHPPIWIRTQRHSFHGLPYIRSSMDWNLAGTVHHDDFPSVSAPGACAAFLAIDCPFPAQPLAPGYSPYNGYSFGLVQSGGNRPHSGPNTHLTQTRYWRKMLPAPAEDLTIKLLKITRRVVHGSDYSQLTLPPVTEIIEVTISAGESTSNPVNALPDFTQNLADEMSETVTVDLIPVEVAPEVLAVNSDFDEGRIDAATGYAIPDCDDPDIALEAVRNHLDGKYSINERVTDDMHPGFFGVNPSSLGNDFWTGAHVTIRKIDKDDPATGHPESGHIRLYGKWGDGPSEYRAIVPYDFDTLATTNLADGGINRAPGESVYGATSPFPVGTSYYIEGVHPGKITLEWRYQKGSIDFKHEQSFKIYTKKSAPQWRFDLDYKIRLETSNDPSGEIRTIEYPLISDGYPANIERAAEFYDFYRECFHEPLRSHPAGYPHAMSWPGLARLAGSQLIGGLSDSEWGKRALQGSILVPAVYPILNPLISGWSIGEIDQLQLALFQGGWQIFASAGWQHHAFRSSVYEAIEWVATNTADPDAPLMLSAWGDLRQGVLDHDKILIDSTALEITDREQNHTIVPTWTVISGLGLGLVDDMFSILGTNSCTPAGLDFTDLFDVSTLPPSTPPKPLGNLAVAADRWVWIQPGTAGGILDTWNTQPMARKLSLSGDSLKSDAMRFSTFSKVSTLIPILSWDDADIP